MQKVFNQIWVTFQKEGVHLYPAAKDDPKLATGGADDVSFLGYAHRHIFHFNVGIQGMALIFLLFLPGDSSTYSIVEPPLTLITWPVTKLASMEAR